MRECYLICYDITAARRLRKVAVLMQEHGERVQKSVFECWLSPAELAILLARVQALLNDSTDSVRVYRLCRRCTSGRRLLGMGTLQDAPTSVVL